MFSYLALMRPQQYVKNLLVFAPAFFGGQILVPATLVSSTLTFFIFCLAASCVYVLNDIFDIEKDKIHPSKQFRPLASGKVSKARAWILFTVLLISSLGASVFVHESLIWVVAAYIILNVAYSSILKHIALLDVFIIAIGFVLRLFAGHITTEIGLSEWIVIMTFLLALFMALAKRRDDLILGEKTGKQMRNAAKNYNLRFLDASITAVLSVTMVAYIAYTTDSIGAVASSRYTYLTSLFVLAGLLRYLQLTMVLNRSGSPTRIFLTDIPVQVIVLAWVVTFGFIIY